ncbi:MAG: DUF349 domain-containing protein [Bacteroidales bacterium]|nr:DUF349 domain-containing protein [Bacteroidales bacterium]
MDLKRNSAVTNENDLALDVVEILGKCRNLSDSANIEGSNLHEEMERLKSQFYSAVNTKKESADSESLKILADLEAQFKEIYAAYKSDRKVRIEDMEKVKEENYAAKLQIIEELKTLLEKAEDVTHTFPEFRDLQNRWKSIDAVPAAKARNLWETYQHYVEKFYDYIKINNEFRDIDFKKNLEAKTLLCEKAEALANEANVVNAFKELQKLHESWKELGPVAKEYREAIWGRFKAITSEINRKHQQYFEQLKIAQKKNLEDKEILCLKAEEIAQANPDSSGEWNKLSKKMDALQAQWKNVGFAAKKDNQKIYDRFRVACDAFYKAKREYYNNFKNVMSENLKIKEQLCEKAESLVESKDWKKATDQFIALQKQWKEVGPVARKQSDAVWKRFRAACDTFFDNKSRHMDAEDVKYEENLALKESLIAEVKEYQICDAKEKNIGAMREFQNRWNAIGFVPFKEKERVQKEFNEAMDAHFADIRSLDSEKKLNKFRRMVIEVKNSGKGDRGLKFEREKLLLKYRKMEQDIATLENNMGFFAKSKNADSMISDLEKKIAVAREELARIEEKINIIDSQFE